MPVVIFVLFDAVLFFYDVLFTCFITITNVCLFNFELTLIFLKLLNKLTTIKSILSISLFGN